MKSKKRKVFRIIFRSLLALLLILTIVFWSLITYGVEQGLGQLHIIREAKPVEEFMKDPTFPDSLKQRLYLIEEIRRYAIDSLGLRNTENYTTMFDQKGEEVMWVVSASEPFQLKPKTWWFPVVGSVPYKGHFDKEKAITEAKKLKDEGWDVAIRNPGGWSTLGWFTEPLLTGMLERSEGDLASLIIHEMVHPTLWVPGDVTFNENIASFIADTAAYDFLRSKYGENSQQYERYLYEDRDYRKFAAFMLRAATHLDSVYTSMNVADSISIKKKIKEDAIRNIVSKMDTIGLHLNAQPSKRFKDRLPNNTYFINYRHYQASQSQFKEEFGRDFKGDIKSYIRYLSNKYPVL
jgi:predicted aminopeptidase